VNSVANPWQWDDLRFFLAAAHAGSLSGAARLLGVNHVRVARRIEFLEKQLGTRLVSRRPDGLALTNAGASILTKCQAMQDTAQEVERLVSGHDERAAGRVRVTATEPLGTQTLVPVLATLHSSYPDLQVDLETGIRTLDLARGEADIAMRISMTRPSQSGIVCRKLGLVGSTLYSSESYLAKRGSPKRGRGFCGHDLITFVGARWPESLGLLFMGESLDGARISLRSNDQYIQLQAAIEGIGIVELPCFLADRHQELKRLWPVEAPFLRPVWLATHRDLRRATRIQVVTAAIVSGFEREARILRYGRGSVAVQQA